MLATARGPGRPAGRISAGPRGRGPGWRRAPATGQSGRLQRALPGEVGPLVSVTNGAGWSSDSRFSPGSGVSIHRTVALPHSCTTGKYITAPAGASGNLTRI